MTWSGYLEKVAIKRLVIFFFLNYRSLEQPGLIRKRDLRVDNIITKNSISMQD